MDNTTKQCKDIPIFYGQPDKDTITLEYFVSRINNSVSAFTLNQKMAYVAFTTSLRGAASHWLQYFTEVNRHNVQEWTAIRSHFCKAFSNDNISNSYTYASAITSTSAIASSPNGDTFTAAQLLQIKGLVHDGLNELRDDLETHGVQIDNMTQFVGHLVTGPQQTGHHTHPDTTYKGQSQNGGNTKRTTYQQKQSVTNKPDHSVFH